MNGINELENEIDRLRNIEDRMLLDIAFYDGTGLREAVEHLITIIVSMEK